MFRRGVQGTVPNSTCIFLGCDAVEYAQQGYLEEQEMTEKVYGPASYFPSIEKKYGQPIAYWFEIVRALGDIKHMEKVNHLKETYAMGHGHANAIVGYLKAKDEAE